MDNIYNFKQFQLACNNIQTISNNFQFWKSFQTNINQLSLIVIFSINPKPIFEIQNLATNTFQTKILASQFFNQLSIKCLFESFIIKQFQIIMWVSSIFNQLQFNYVCEILVSNNFKQLLKLSKTKNINQSIIVWNYWLKLLIVQ